MSEHAEESAQPRLEIAAFGALADCGVTLAEHVCEDPLVHAANPTPPPAHDHSAAATCGRSCPAYGDMLMEKTAARLGTTQTQNERGEWVPAIPEPLFIGFRMRRARCGCGETLGNRRRYREHFALIHVLGLS